MSEQADDDLDDDDLDVAIIGMAGRFPGAGSCDELWDALCAGRESITRFDRSTLLAAGWPAAQIDDPAFVPARGVLEGAESFDAGFFGFSPREAEILDPQQRVFLECAWHALEDAGYDPRRYEREIGVFAGVGVNTYLLEHILPNRARVSAAADDFRIMILNDKDTLPTRVSYKLGLRGPAVDVQTSCSTGLVAVHLACNSLLNFECDIALAGAVAVKFPQVGGYRFEPDGILSPDGHCRAFDAAAAGTVGGSGVGVVVLKRSGEARADGDLVRALVRGSAINNDGSRKVSYTAPSVLGQSEVIAAAHARARVSPEDIGYVEAHGTGTPVGDPIEIAALTRVFRATTDRRGFCAIGSVKTNLGHLDTAAGMAGIIKTTLALERGERPPSLHFERPNPELGLDDGPFFVDAALTPWPRADAPRRAGVSSFGVGGTNAHVVLQEPPTPSPRAAPSRPVQLLTCSSRSPGALVSTAERLRSHLGTLEDEAELADAAFTLHVGRAELEHRWALLGREPRQLRTIDPIVSRGPVGSAPTIVFLFPGQGSQRPGMSRGLYEQEPTFRSWIDRGAETLRPELDRDLRELLLAAPDAPEAEEALAQTRWTQPALFVHEYALTCLWAEWGIRPTAMLGHSVGEYVAACVAGVMSYDDALAVVAERGAAMQAQPEGAMVAIQAEAGRVEALLPPRASIAAINAPRRCVASGPTPAIARLEQRLIELELPFRRLRTSHAFHSSLIEPMLGRFERSLGGLPLHPPAIPIASNVTGTWLTPEEATSPAYWARHAMAPVRFADGVGHVARSRGGALWLEVGPGGALCSAARAQLDAATHGLAAPHRDQSAEVEGMLGALARLWVEGAVVDWDGFHAHEKRRRVRLPGQAFERSRHFIDVAGPGRDRPSSSGPIKRPLPSWFHHPSFVKSPRLDVGESIPEVALVLGAGGEVGTAVAEALARKGARVVTVEYGPSFARHGDAFVLPESDPQAHPELLRRLEAMDARPDVIVHARVLETAPAGSSAGLLSATALVKAIVERPWTQSIRVLVLTENACAVTGDERIDPEHGELRAWAKVVPQEHPNLCCIHADIARDSAPLARIVDQLVAELTAESLDAEVAFRGDHRWVEHFLQISAPPPSAARLEDGGTYLVLGGLGRVGLLTAEVLARRPGATIVLADLRDEPTTEVAEVLSSLGASGARIERRRVDMAEPDALDALVRDIVDVTGRLDGVVHAAGCQEELVPVAETTAEVYARHFAAKVEGSRALARAIEDHEVGFVVLLSSLASLLGGLGHAAYAASNGFMDALAYAHRRSNTSWISVNVETWDLGPSPAEFAVGGGASRLALAMTRDETRDVLARILSIPPGISQLVVSTADLDARRVQWIRPGAVSESPRSAVHPRPELGVEYVPPSTETERAVVEIWRDILGIDTIGMEDNFFELGGDSLMATQIVSRARAAFEMDLPLRRLFETPTPRALCALVDDARSRATEAGEIERLLVEIEGMEES